MYGVGCDCKLLGCKLLATTSAAQH